MSPCNASAACRNRDGVPVLEKVADAFFATCPDLPSPIVIIFPLHSNITLHAFSKFKLILFAILFSAKASCLITFFATDILLIFFIYLSHIS